MATLPATAGAYATPEPPPKYSAAPGLPDGRVYEQVSPADKNGNEAGATGGAFDTGAKNHYGLAAPDGNSVLFEGTGAMGASPWSASEWFVATKNQGAAGWSTHAALPAAQQPLEQLEGLLYTKLQYLDPSEDLTHMLIQAGPYTLAPISGCGNRQIYLAGPDPFVAAAWLESPEIADPVENCATNDESGVPVGGSPDFSTVYFTYPGTLLAEDASRNPHAGSGSLVEAWGFYEDREGVLREAGVLPDGKLDEFGAVPAASGHGSDPYGNGVSGDGSRAFFVSPDPASCESEGPHGEPTGGHNNCKIDPPELYVHEEGKELATLVSRDELVPSGQAPGGVLQMHNPSKQVNLRPALDGSYVFASPDGSQAFFQSEDQLTAEAPAGAGAKTYDFDVNTGVLRYLPGVSGQLVASDTDGSAVAFVRPEVDGAPAELDLWSGPGSGSITSVTQLPGGPSSGLGRGEYVSEAQLASDGSALAFVTSALIAGFNNGGTHEVGKATEPGTEQVYRYDVPAHTLGCVSCAPAGVTPSGDASMSVLRAGGTYELEAGVTEGLSDPGMVNERGMSADGDQIFFDTPDSLVSRDTNADSPEVEIGEDTFVKQGRDVYEWDDGVVYLISTGKSARDSYLLGSSENGDDVFFATAEGLVSGDTDGGFDVYDARIPHPGDNPPAAAVPCEGAVCQGARGGPSPLTPPASATFAGLGNPPPETTASAKTTTKTVKCAKGKKLSHGKCVKVKSKKKKAKAKKASHNGRTKS